MNSFTAKYFVMLAIAILMIASKPAACQAIPAVKSSGLGFFGALNGADLGRKGTPALSDDKALGVTAGAYLQSPGLLGVEIRGTADKWSASFPQYSAAGGLRAQVRQNRFREYVFVGAGLSHARYPTGVHLSTAEWGTVVDFAGGLDLSLHVTHLSWRVVEISYKRIFVDGGINSFDGSTGLVYRF